ncbi:MAG: tripartite tricarboxylate transporter TctB family protein [Thermodesulfobacteriota bacterium]
MSKDSKPKIEDLSTKELKELRGELWVIPAFLVFAFVIFVGSFQYKFEAAMVPMLIGAVAVILAGMRFLHILFPKTKIGEFRERGLAGEFDNIEKKIKDETLKDKYEEAPEKTLSFRDERTAFIALISCLVVFLLFGHFVGIFYAIVGTSYYYGFKKKIPLLISLVAMYLIVYLLLNKLLEGPVFFGLILGPILESLDLI